MHSADLYMFMQKVLFNFFHAVLIQLYDKYNLRDKTIALLFYCTAKNGIEIENYYIGIRKLYVSCFRTGT